MAKKPNYDFEKRRKELDRKAKKDAKREGRLLRRNEGSLDESTMPADDTDGRPSQSESADPTVR